MFSSFIIISSTPRGFSTGGRSDEDKKGSQKDLQIRKNGVNQI